MIRQNTPPFSETFYIKGTLAKASGVLTKLWSVEITPPAVELFQTKGIRQSLWCFTKLWSVKITLPFTETLKVKGTLAKASLL